jgi:tetratricopeptide (TPR) repeat protein
MQKINFEKERQIIDREITYFHFKKAKRRIDKCIKKSTQAHDKFFINYFLAQDEILHDNFRLAIHYIDKALKLRPQDGCSYNDRALCLAELGKCNLALEWFNRGIGADGNCASLYHNKGWLLNSMASHREAVVCFHKALELDEARPEALYSLGDSYLALGQKTRAHSYFNKALMVVCRRSAYIRKHIEKRIKSLEK